MHCHCKRWELIKLMTVFLNKILTYLSSSQLSSLNQPKFWQKKAPSFSALVLLNWSNLASWVSSKKDVLFSWMPWWKTYMPLLNPPQCKTSWLAPLNSNLPIFSVGPPQLILQFWGELFAESASLFDVTMKCLQTTTHSHLFEDFSRSTLTPWMIWVMLLIL